MRSFRCSAASPSAIRMREETKTLGLFFPKKHDGGSYLTKASYTFLDAETARLPDQRQTMY